MLICLFQLSDELVAKLEHHISVNIAAIDETYLHGPLGDHSVYTGTAGK